jgi:RNA polymerase sigma-70 factor (ECF subfamily)
MTQTSPDIGDRALTTAALGGDEAALGQLLERHQQPVYNAAYRLLGNDPDARDAVQEGFILAVRAIRGNGEPPRDPDRFGPWLRRVVLNAALGQLRRRPAFRLVSVDEVADPPPSPEYDDPARVLERREARGNILLSLLSLPDRQRAALTLRDYEELPYEQIAASLGVSRPAAERLLFRARRGFRAAYEGLADAEQAKGCPGLAQRMSAALDGELDPAATQDLQAHLDACAGCRTEIAALRRMRELGLVTPLVAIPAGWKPVQSALATHAAAAGAATASPAAASTAAAKSSTGGVMAKLATLPTAAKLAAVTAAVGGLGATTVLTSGVLDRPAPPANTPPSPAPSPALVVPATSPSPSPGGSPVPQVLGSPEPTSSPVSPTSGPQGAVPSPVPSPAR